MCQRTHSELVRWPGRAIAAAVASLACSYAPSSPPPQPPCWSRLRPMPLRFRPRFTTVGESAFVVPSGVHQLDVAVTGARGGNTFDDSGGRGALVRGTLAVTPGERLYAVVGGAGTNFTGGSSSAIKRGRRQRRRQRVRRRRRRLGSPDRAARLRDHAGEPACDRRRWRRSRLRRGARRGRRRARWLVPQPDARRTARNAIAGRRRRHGDRGRRERDSGQSRSRRRRHGAEHPRRWRWRRVVRRRRRRRRGRLQPVRVLRRRWRRLVAGAGRRDLWSRGADRCRAGGDRLRPPGRGRERDAPRVPRDPAGCPEPEPDDRGDQHHAHDRPDVLRLLARVRRLPRRRHELRHGRAGREVPDLRPLRAVGDRPARRDAADQVRRRPVRHRPERRELRARPAGGGSGADAPPRADRDHAPAVHGQALHGDVRQRAEGREERHPRPRHADPGRPRLRHRGREGPPRHAAARPQEPPRREARHVHAEAPDRREATTTAAPSRSA